MSKEEDGSLDACQPPNKRIVLERQRRKRISMSCERLRKLLPTFHGRQNDMASILEMTVEYLRLAHEHLPERQQSTLPNLPAPAELSQGPDEAHFPVSQPGETASENTQSAPIPFREGQPPGSVEASPKATKAEGRLVPEGTRLLEAGAAPIGVIRAGCPQPPEEPVALLCETGDPTPLLSSTSQRWLTRLSDPPGPPLEEDFLLGGLKPLPRRGPTWPCSEPGPQEEMLDADAKVWKDEPEFKLVAEGKPATGVLLPRPEWMPWMSEQDVLNPARTPGSPVLFEEQATAAWDGKSGLHYPATPEAMETGILETYGLLAPDKELEP